MVRHAKNSGVAWSRDFSRASSRNYSCHRTGCDTSSSFLERGKNFTPRDLLTKSFYPLNCLFDVLTLNAGKCTSRGVRKKKEYTSYLFTRSIYLHTACLTRKQIFPPGYIQSELNELCSNVFQPIFLGKLRVGGGGGITVFVFYSREIAIKK